jgi:hypothetical protein
VSGLNKAQLVEAVMRCLRAADAMQQ